MSTNSITSNIVANPCLPKTKPGTKHASARHAVTENPRRRHITRISVGDDSKVAQSSAVIRRHRLICCTHLRNPLTEIETLASEPVRRR